MKQIFIFSNLSNLLHVNNPSGIIIKNTKQDEWKNLNIKLLPTLAPPTKPKTTTPPPTKAQTTPGGSEEEKPIIPASEKATVEKSNNNTRTMKG